MSCVPVTFGLHVNSLESAALLVGPGYTLNLKSACINLRSTPDPRCKFTGPDGSFLGGRPGNLLPDSVRTTLLMKRSNAGIRGQMEWYSIGTGRPGERITLGPGLKFPEPSANPVLAMESYTKHHPLLQSRGRR